MGDFTKHIDMACEKLAATIHAFNNKQTTVVGDLATKVVEQFIEADAARSNEHFGDHKSRHMFANRNYPPDVNAVMRKIWYAYGNLGYEGANGKRAQIVMDNLKLAVTFFEDRLSRKLWQE